MNLLSSFVTLAVCLCALAACGTEAPTQNTPSIDPPITNPILTSGADATSPILRIRFPTACAGKVEAEIFIDGQSVGRFSHLSWQDFRIAMGKHLIEVKAPSGRSAYVPYRMEIVKAFVQLTAICPNA